MSISVLVGLLSAPCAYPENGALPLITGPQASAGLNRCRHHRAVRNLHSFRPPDVGEIRSVGRGAERRVGEGCSAERVAEVRAAEAEVRAGEVRAGEVRAGEVRAGEVRAGEVRAGEVRAG